MPYTVDLYLAISPDGTRNYLCPECSQDAVDRGHSVLTDKVYHGAYGCEWCGEGCNVPYDGSGECGGI